DRESLELVVRAGLAVVHEGEVAAVAHLDDRRILGLRDLETDRRCVALDAHARDPSLDVDRKRNRGRDCPEHEVPAWILPGRRASGSVRPLSSNSPSASQRSGCRLIACGLIFRSGSGGPSGSRFAALWKSITAIPSRMSTFVVYRDSSVSSSSPAFSSLRRSHMPGNLLVTAWIPVGFGGWPAACQSRKSCWTRTASCADRCTGGRV